MGYTIWPDGKTGDVLQDIYRERLRQEQLKAEGRFPHTCADPELSHFERLPILAEEFGEVGRALNELAGLANDKHGVDLRKELIQVAAVAAAWAEALS